VVSGFDVNEPSDSKSLTVEEENGGNMSLSPVPLETAPNREIRTINTEEDNQQTASQYEQKQNDTPYSELFGRRINPQDKIDIENSPFDFFEPDDNNEPTAKDLDTFTEADELPLKPEKSSSITKNEEEKPKPDNNQEYFTEDSADRNQTKEKGIEVDNSFLAKLSGLKADILKENRNSVGVGMLYHTRTGSSGLDMLDSFILPSIDANYYLDLSHHFYGHINFMNMSNGQITGDALSRYGDMKSGGNVESANSLVELFGGYKYKGEKYTFTVEAGTVPKPTVVPKSPMVWVLKIDGKNGKLSYDIAYVNRSVKDSMLSRIGDTYNWVDTNGEDNPDTEDINESYQSGTNSRGGVTKTGVEVGAKLSVDDEVFAGNISYYYDISGYNVVKNEEIALTLLYLRLLDIPKFNSFMVGPIFLYDNYTYNSGYFTMGRDGVGNGGYFSPKNFILLGLYFDIARMIDNQFFWKLKGNFGFITFTSGKDLFNDTSSEAEISSFGYEVKSFGGYMVDDTVELIGGIGYQSSGAYKSLFFGLSAIYYFEKKKSNSIKDLMYSNTIGEMAK